MGIREPGKFKEQGEPSGLGRNAQYEKIDEMDKLIKDLSNKLSKMEMENPNLALMLGIQINLGENSIQILNLNRGILRTIKKKSSSF
jgi:hypothetical protein